MLNPIEHSRTKETAQKYKVEPYVLAADIYGAENLIGHGGWTWYTGASSWFYKAGIEYILGLKIYGNAKTKRQYIRIEPCIPREWKEYVIKYKYGNSIYVIKIKNMNGKNSGVSKILINGKVLNDSKIELVDNEKVNEIDVEM